VADLFPPNRNEFEAEADRAREEARTLLADSVAAEEAADQQSEVTDDGRSLQARVVAVVDRIRSILGGRR